MHHDRASLIINLLLMSSYNSIIYFGFVKLTWNIPPATCVTRVFGRTRVRFVSFWVGSKTAHHNMRV